MFLIQSRLKRETVKINVFAQSPQSTVHTAKNETCMDEKKRISQQFVMES